MSTTPLEKVFEAKCMKVLKTLPNSYWLPKEHPRSAGANPDRQGVINSISIHLEFKRSLAEAKKTTGRTKRQRYRLDMLQNAGAFAEFVYPENWEKILNDLRAISFFAPRVSLR